MATPSPDPSPGKSWRQLTDEARTDSQPPEIDVSVSVRAAITSEPRESFATPDQQSLWSDLQALAQLTWLRASLGGAALAVAILCMAGTNSLRELHEWVQIAGPLVAGL